MSFLFNTIPGAVFHQLVFGGNSPKNIGRVGLGLRPRIGLNHLVCRTVPDCTSKKEFLVAVFVGQHYGLSNDLQDVLRTYLKSNHKKSQQLLKWKREDKMPVLEGSDYAFAMCKYDKWTSSLPPSLCSKVQDNEQIENDFESLPPPPNLVTLADAQK
ncbi:hypothetical protein DFJ77DRAFT_436790 [Powellomyces hirtus]|nr:hypothetical protein DFJ77DRAFT_436790 [Powellomyces hirtus]